MKPKNQGALVIEFIEGATEGAIGTLLIYNNTLYNTEGEEFMPISRRIGPDGHNLTYVINTDEHTQFHGMYNYHKRLVLDAIRDLNMERTEEVVGLFIPMPTYSRPFENHPIDEKMAKLTIKRHRETIDGLEDKVINLENGTHLRSDYENEYTPEELTQDAENQMKQCIRICDYLKEDLEEVEIGQQMKDIEELVRLPQILEEAIKDGGMNAKDLHKIIATRDRVQNTLDTIEKYMAVILAIPNEPGDRASTDEAADDPLPDTTDTTDTTITPVARIPPATPHQPQSHTNDTDYTTMKKVHEMITNYQP